MKERIPRNISRYCDGIIQELDNRNHHWRSGRELIDPHPLVVAIVEEVTLEEASTLDPVRWDGDRDRGAWATTPKRHLMPYDALSTSMTSAISPLRTVARLSSQSNLTRSPFQTLNCVRLFSAMAGKLSSERAEDFVDFLNASPTRTTILGHMQVLMLTTMQLSMPCIRQSNVSRRLVSSR